MTIHTFRGYYTVRGEKKDYSIDYPCNVAASQAEPPGGEWQVEVVIVTHGESVRIHFTCQHNDDQTAWRDAVILRVARLRPSQLVQSSESVDIAGSWATIPD